MNTSVTAETLRQRTKLFAVNILKFYKNVPKTIEAQIIGKQLLRSATSVASNYRAACRGRSEAEFYSKLSIVVEEADETQFWFELLIEADILSERIIKPYIDEASELTAIFTSSRKTLKDRISK